MQAVITDCLVLPGFGVVSSPAAGLAAFAVNTAGMSITDKANLVVLECPVEYYGDGAEVGSTCTPCPCGSTTTTTGATSVDACNGKHPHDLLRWSSQPVLASTTMTYLGACVTLLDVATCQQA
jgi:hypothetical protein